MVNRFRVFLIWVVAVAAGCGSIELTTGPSGDSVPLIRLRTEPYSFTHNSGFRESDRLVVRDAVQWSTVWARVHEGGTVSALPAVDFSREMVVVAAMGTRSSGGFGILIDEATELGANGVSVSVRSISPGPRCVVTGALTQPVDIARLPRRDGAVRFTERAEVLSCT